ncbi:MAG: sigma-70 family RNA polymerase sigma factor [Phycisphaerales bacterium]|nr:sigma-70 family RNA polymerase sigma factor [Phycisphaerales bacterium]
MSSSGIEQTCWSSDGPESSSATHEVTSKELSITSPQTDDWKLMQRIASGEENAVEELYDRFSPLIFKASRQILPTNAEAEDAVQEVYLRLWQTADRYDPRRAKLVTWVMLITRRHLIDRLRRKSARPSPGKLDESTGIAADLNPSTSRLSDDESADLLRKRIGELPELQRTVIERAYLQGFTLREVASQLDAPLGTVKSALSRGLNRLRERIRLDRSLG